VLDMKGNREEVLAKLMSRGQRNAFTRAVHSSELLARALAGTGEFGFGDWKAYAKTMRRELVPLVVLVLGLACVERPTPTVEPTSSEPAVVVETPVANEPTELGAIEGAVEAKIGFRQGDQCTIDPVGVEFPLAAADGSEVVLMGRYDTYFDGGHDVRDQGLWRLGAGYFSMFGDYMQGEAIMLIDWIDVDDVTTCDEAEGLAASAVAEANAYLATKRWFPLEEVEDFDYHGGREAHYSCVLGTQLNLCASETGFAGELLNDDWISYRHTWLYVSLRACMAVAVQYKQGEDGPMERTAIEVFDIAGIVAALPPEYAVECGAG
jgi:hypothetical protein